MCCGVDVVGPSMTPSLLLPPCMNAPQDVDAPDSITFVWCQQKLNGQCVWYFRKEISTAILTTELSDTYIILSSHLPLSARQSMRQSFSGVQLGLLSIGSNASNWTVMSVGICPTMHLELFWKINFGNFSKQLTQCVHLANKRISISMFRVRTWICSLCWLSLASCLSDSCTDRRSHATDLDVCAPCGVGTNLSVFDNIPTKTPDVHLKFNLTPCSEWSLKRHMLLGVCDAFTCILLITKLA